MAENKNGLSLYIFTWNVCGQKPSAECLDLMFQRDHDLYIIGTQEYGQPLKKAVVYSDFKAWEEQVLTWAGEEYGYVHSESMAGLNLLILQKKSINLKHKILGSDVIATGFANVIGNKGAVWTAITICDEDFLFVNAHFHAHQDEVLKRNEDFSQITKGIEAVFHNRKGENLTEKFDHIFWMGDLNYRVSGNRAIVDACISKGYWEVMIANDQLTSQKAAKRVFEHYNEGALSFPPTYKFNIGSRKYDTSAKARIPSWTDRIL